MEWYKRHAHRALTGMLELTLEERGVYNTLLDLIYTKGGEIDDDQSFICRWLCCDPRVWRRIKQSLIDKNKIYIINGKIRNNHADFAIMNYRKKQNSGSTPAQLHPYLGQRCTPVSNKNNDLSLLEKESEKKPPPAPPSHQNYRIENHVSEDGWLDARSQAPGWDIHALALIYNNKIQSGDRKPPKNPNTAFPAWCKTYTKGKPPS